MPATANTPAEDGSHLHAELVALLDATGPRPSCSPAERALGTRLSQSWSTFADEVRDEAFTCHPVAFLAAVPLASAAVLAGLVLLPWMPAVAAAVALLGASVFALELLWYREVLDPLFPAAEGVNVVGRIQPSGEVRQRVVLSAHQDSAWEFTLWYRLGQAAIPVHLLAMVSGLVPVVGGLLGAAGVWGPQTLWTLTGLGALLSPFAIAHLFFHRFRPVPGAMDDLAGLVVLSAAGRALADEPLSHTEVVLLACSAEECGLRGAKRFAAAHAHTLRQVPTVDLNVDGVYDEAFLSVVTTELTLGVRHDPGLIATAQAQARALGHEIAPVVIPFGATDAAAFAQAGVRTVSLLAQDTAHLAPNYHTRRDTPDKVRPEALQTMRDLVVGMVRQLDEEARLDATLRHHPFQDDP